MLFTFYFFYEGFNYDDFIKMMAGCRAVTSSPIEMTKKEICKVFEKYNLKIKIDSNNKIVIFLNVTFDWDIEQCKPYQPT